MVDLYIVIAKVVNPARHAGLDPVRNLSMGWYFFHFNF
jgi:hypothetical protein